MSHPRAQALTQQALLHHHAGRLSAAAALYAQARAAQPTYFDAFHLGGAVALQQSQLKDALALLTRAVALNPRAASSFMCLGLAHAALGRHAEAEAALRHSLKLDPKNSEAWNHLSSIFVLTNRLADAENSYREAIRLQPRYAQGWTGLGSVLQLQGRFAEAIDHHTRALQLDPHHPKARSSRAQSLQSCHRIDEALADFDGHLAKSPDDMEARSYRLFLLNYYANVSREKIYAEHLAFGRLAAQRAPIPLPPLPPRTAHSSRLRIAILSPDLRTHSVAYFIEPLLRHLDRDRFELFLYHDHFCNDDTSVRLRALASVWRQFVGLSDSVVADQIRHDAPDILIDLAGHTGCNRLGLYAQRLAPVQISYLGYPNTTGLAAMDFRFTDSVADPEGDSDAFHSEKLIRFSPCAWTYSPPPAASLPTPPPCLATGHITFGSFNNLSKLNDCTLRLWASALHAVPHSRLLLKSHGLSPGLLDTRLAAAQIDPARVEIVPTFASIAEHLALYSRIDLALDPTPYNGTTTTCEALWMGVPVLTLRGDRHASRVGASLLTAIGHPEWIASSPAEFAATARTLTADPSLLTTIRQSLRSDVQRSTLLAHAAQAQRFGDALFHCAQPTSCVPVS